jgi:hypothetical protein
MSAAERNTEIWSTRLQRELLALTTDNAPQEATDEIISVLPNFVSVKDHELNIEKGICVVSFYVRPKQDMPNPIIVSVDASLQKNEKGDVDPLAVAYPFLKPAAVLKFGSKNFPKGSTIREGDNVDIEMDWTPSLHLTDAILNIALKIKESILQNEPFHPIMDETNPSLAGEMADKARRVSASVKAGLKGLAKSGDKASPGKRMKKKQQKARRGKRDQIRIGDEISMLDAPWVDCQGVYSCKAIRRPTFVEDAMATAVKKREIEQVRQMFQEDSEEIPNDLGDFMRMQTGFFSQVCCVFRFFQFNISHHFSTILSPIGCRCRICRSYSEYCQFGTRRFGGVILDDH